MSKLATALGSAMPDPTKSMDAISPSPSPVVENKVAPGQTGPRGLSPRTTYSRVNTGSPPTPDTSALKMAPPRGAEFLPPKVAQMTTSLRPTLQDMIKAAMEGTVNKVNVEVEAQRQYDLSTGGYEEKTASAQFEHCSTEYVSKIASALGYIIEQVKEANHQPGTGPGALTVLEAHDGSSILEPGQSGHATPHGLPAASTTQTEKTQSGKANTGLTTNDSDMHKKQPLEPITNQKAPLGSKHAGVAGFAQGAAKNIGHAFSKGGVRGAASMAKSVGKDGAKSVGDAIKANPLKSAGGAAAGLAAVGGGAALASRKKEASALYAANLTRLGLHKEAEDALNHAHVSGGSAAPNSGVESGEGAPAEPSDVNSQKRLIQSNEAAINYTKGQAKADPKSDVNQVLSQPALSSAHDNVLQKAFAHTGQAGVKFASATATVKEAAVKTAAARALLSNLLQKVAAECAACSEGECKEHKKEKKSMMGAAPSTPAAASGFTASSLS